MSDAGPTNEAQYDFDRQMTEAEPIPTLSVVDDYEEIANKEMPQMEEDIVETKVYHWDVTNWRNLSDREQSPVFEAGGHKWNVLLFPRGNNQHEQLSVYLEFADLRDEGHDPEVYSCAQFLICLSPPSDPTHYVCQASHRRFHRDESDWGFTRFVDLRRLYQADANTGTGPFVEDDQLRISVIVRGIQDPTGVLWHNFVNYDSKKMTGYVGLKNQGATCYMNSLFQSLYCTNFFRKAVYQIPTENDDPNGSIALSLQRLFYNLQFDSDSVGTLEVTRSFGWNSADAFMQHDVQEFNRVLQDALEVKMKNTPADGAIKKLFEGKMKSFIKCINVNYESSRSEDYYDIQLNVKGCKNLEESFKDYVAEETLEGDNKYMAEGHGLQDAKKGVIFESFPPVLHLQLKRFEYDIQKDAMVKINDRHEFPLEIDLEPYLSDDADRSQSHKYALHGVLVHSGDLTGGHYFAFVKPTKDGKWLKFDDDRVVPATSKEVLEENFGGELLGGAGMNGRPNMRGLKRFTNAYMLVYVRESMRDEILSPVSKDDIPEHLVKKLEVEREERIKEEKDRAEQHLYMRMYLVTDEHFQSNTGFDFVELYDRQSSDKTLVQSQPILKKQKYGAFMQELAEKMGKNVNEFRLWLLMNRQNRTVRPETPITNNEKEMELTMEQIKQKYLNENQPLKLYVETATVYQNGQPYFPPPPSNTAQQVLVFIKLFDPELQRVRGIGRLYVPLMGKVGSIMDQLNDMAGFEPGTLLSLYEEIKPSMIDAMNTGLTFSEAEIQDGDIICIQKELRDDDIAQYHAQGLYPNVPEFMDYQLNKVQVVFTPKDKNPEHVVTLALHKQTKYNDVAIKLAEQLDADPEKIQFFNIGVQDEPKAAIRRSLTSSLEDMLHTPYPTRNHHLKQKVFYEVLDIKLSELESKRQVKITLCTPTLKDCETTIIWVSKQARIADLLRELGVVKDQQENKSNKFLSANGTRRVRVFEAISNRFHREFLGTDALALLSESPTAQLYVEEIPQEELEMRDDDIFIRVFHYQRDTSRTHSVPFKFLVRKDEPLSETKQRLQARTGLGDKEWSKVKFNIVTTYSAAPIDEAVDFKLSDHQFNRDDSLGLDHIDRTGRANRIGLEKPLSIRG
ncbi:cysteine proteinase [Zychaea mexicana]|uniref:cysteine proteinase n=1 Tax=Zychaea mexicana TaxID=64656 RepID=UPI0022FDF9C5|nr:cysteine proteinase [Zychaea mexicana]KAI9484595.1 cysteine proteinase [Zychaea mexicana]